MIKLPGLIDPHVHLRTPGQEYKEDFLTGTSAALAGGYTTIIDMPNNVVPITTAELLLEKQNIAKNQIVCDVGFHFGSLGDNFEEFKKIFPNPAIHPGGGRLEQSGNHDSHGVDGVMGLKIYLNVTTGNYIVDEKVFRSICEAWSANKPILVHAEADVLESIINIAQEFNQKLHICHVSSEKELTIIMQAKEKGFPVTCGVTPHHLFLTEDDVVKLGPFGQMKPTLKTKSDRNFLWNKLEYIDVIESDHAPHTIEEKESNPPPFGVPGLETTLPLLLTAMNQGRITLEEIKRLCLDNPAKIFNIQTDDQTYIEIDENEEWTLKNEDLLTKCKWSPFNNWKMKGKVKSVTIRGTKVFENGKVLVKPGFGSII